MLNATTPVRLTIDDLPGLDCGLCGFRTCEELAARLETQPELAARCIHLSDRRVVVPATVVSTAAQATAVCGDCAVSAFATRRSAESAWKDTLGRDIDFYLEHFPEEPGPREIILPHNPLITREMNIRVGDILIGRPLGMSCGCPITHCGVAMDVDLRTGVIVWCVTGPLNPRQKGFKDLGYYIAEGYEGLIMQKRCEIKIGMRYFFQPRMCMLQWRHSGLVNFLNRRAEGLQVRVEGLWIG